MAAAGYEFTVIPPSDGAETDPLPGEPPAEIVARLAEQKAANVAGRMVAGLIIGCDTVAECGGQILGSRLIATGGKCSNYSADSRIAFIAASACGSGPATGGAARRRDEPRHGQPQ